MKMNDKKRNRLHRNFIIQKRRQNFNTYIDVNEIHKLSGKISRFDVLRVGLIFEIVKAQAINNRIRRSQ